MYVMGIMSVKKLDKLNIVSQELLLMSQRGVEVFLKRKVYFQKGSVEGRRLSVSIL